jgi:hypothetical protein
MLLVCMPRIRLSYIWPECKHRKPISLLHRILLQILITSPEFTEFRICLEFTEHSDNGCAKFFSQFSHKDLGFKIKDFKFQTKIELGAKLG